MPARRLMVIPPAAHLMSYQMSYQNPTAFNGSCTCPLRIIATDLSKAICQV
jgi:hypothetical protein